MLPPCFFQMVIWVSSAIVVAVTPAHRQRMATMRRARDDMRNRYLFVFIAVVFSWEYPTRKAARAVRCGADCTTFLLILNINHMISYFYCRACLSIV